MVFMPASPCSMMETTMHPGSTFTGYVYAAIGQRANERGYLKIGYATTPETHYATGRATSFRHILLIQPDCEKKLKNPADRLHQGMVAEAVLDLFRRGKDSLYDGRAFPPGYAELVKFDAAHRERLKKRLAANRANPDAVRFLRAVLALWETLPDNPWLAGAPLPEMAMVPPERVALARAAKTADKPMCL